MTPIDPQIIQRSKRGDKEAFSVIVRHYGRMIFSLALKMMHDEDEAKDIVQETLIKLWLNIEHYDTQQSLTTWIYTIAARLCLDKLKSTHPHSPLPDDEKIFHDYAREADPHERLENREWVAITKTLAYGLSPKQKIVFTLCLLEGLSSQEVEKITGLSATQVKSNLYAARQNIKEKLKQSGYE